MHDLADIFTGMGQFFHETGRFDRALYSFEKALSIYNYMEDTEGMYVSLMNLARSAVQRGDREKAGDYCRQAVSLLSPDEKYRLDEAERCVNEV